MLLPDPPPGLDLGATKVPEILGVILTTWSLAVIAVALRVVARRLKGNPLWFEDYLCFVSLTAATVHVFVAVGYMVPHGTGKHIWAGPPDALEAWAIGLFTSDFVYNITLSTVKWSTLAFYFRVFSTSHNTIKIPIWILAGIVFVWSISMFVVTVMQCDPVDSFWMRYDPVNPTPPSDFTCPVGLKSFLNGYINSIPNIVTDGLVVMLPIPYILKLKLPMAQKLAISGIFSLGLFVTTISIVRFTNLLRTDVTSPDVTYTLVDALIWSHTEANCAIVACCLPSLRPIFNLALRGTMSSTVRTEEGKMGSAANAYEKRTKSASRIAQSSFGVSEGNATGLKNGLDVEDERPFARLDDRDSESLNQESGSGYELSPIQGNNAVTVTKTFGFSMSAG